MSYVVYKHTTPNNKVYIGITCRNPIIRWQNGVGYRNNKHFYNAIKKYGWNNIKHEILFTGLTQEEACKKEIELISKYDSTNQLKGFNISTGGDKRTSHFKLDEIARKKISQSKVGKQTWNKGKAWGENIKEKIMLSHKERKKVICNETGIIYESIRDAARKTNINKKNISYCCKRKANYKTAGGYHWDFCCLGGE